MEPLFSGSNVAMCIWHTQVVGGYFSQYGVVFAKVRKEFSFFVDKGHFVEDVRFASFRFGQCDTLVL